MGTLLMDGVGDTMRVSLTADPVKEVEVAWEILKALGLRERGPVMIACPSCGRDNVGVESLAVVVEERLREYPQAFEVAVMGCAVNGPGEAGDADFGIAGGRDVGLCVRARQSAQEGLLRHPDRRAVPRDRPVDRGGDAAPEAAQAGQARRARDGRGEPDPDELPGDPRLRCIQLPAAPTDTVSGMLRRALPPPAFSRPLALVTGCAGATSTSSSIPESASLAPATALAYATVTTDEDSDQWKKAASLLERIPGARDGVSGSIRSALGEQGIDWTNDVRPALGPELVVVATADKQPIVLVQPARRGEARRAARQERHDLRPRSR